MTKPTHHPNSDLPIEGLKQEIRDLFCQVTGDYEPTENDISTLEMGLDNLFLPELPVSDYAAARNSLECTIAWLEAGNDPMQAAKELRLNVSRLVPADDRVPGLAFWITEQESLNELSPAEVLLGASISPTKDASQQRMLSYAPSVRYERVTALVRLHNAELRAQGRERE